MRKVVGWRNPVAMYPMRCVSLTLLMMAFLFPSPTFGQVSPAYEIRDTTAWDNGNLYGMWAGPGHYGLLYDSGVFMDTVDATFGLLRFNSGMIYRRVVTFHSSTFPGHPDTSTVVIDSVLYYWGIRDGERYLTHLSAMRVHPQTLAIDSVPLFEEIFETDAGGLFSRPESAGSLICFRENYGSRVFWLDRDWRVVRRYDTRPPDDSGAARRRWVQPRRDCSNGGGA